MANNNGENNGENNGGATNANVTSLSQREVNIFLFLIYFRKNKLVIDVCIFVID